MLSLLRAQAQSLAAELKCHKPLGTAKKILEKVSYQIISITSFHFRFFCPFKKLWLRFPWSFSNLLPQLEFWAQHCVLLEDLRQNPCP